MRCAALLLAVVSMGCVKAQIDTIARNTRLIDSRFADEYSYAADLCLDQNETRTGYNACMVQWEETAVYVRMLIQHALSLDIVNRRYFEANACRWYQMLELVDQTSPVTLPAAKAGLDSKWKRKCGK